MIWNFFDTTYRCEVIGWFWKQPTRCAVTNEWACLSRHSVGCPTSQWISFKRLILGKKRVRTFFPKIPWSAWPANLGVIYEIFRPYICTFGTIYDPCTHSTCTRGHCHTPRDYQCYAHMPVRCRSQLVSARETRRFTVPSQNKPFQQNPRIIYVPTKCRVYTKTRNSSLPLSTTRK